jgi:excisionase family DNA binding protein
MMKNGIPISSPLLSYREAASYLGVSVSTVERLVRARELIPVSIRYRRLLRRTDLDEYISAQASGGGKK